MSLRKELRKFIAESRGESNVIKILERQIDQLRKHNEALTDRLMSKDIRDYKINTMELPTVKGKPLGPEHDETLIGQQVELPEEREYKG